MISSHWEMNGQSFKWRISVPVNTTATVYVPAKEAKNVKEGGKPVAANKDVKFLRMEEGYAVYEVPSGNYDIQHDL
jgi:alpha-L-rhamnosidase